MPFTKFVVKWNIDIFHDYREKIAWLETMDILDTLCAYRRRFMSA